MRLFDSEIEQPYNTTSKGSVEDKQQIPEPSGKGDSQ